MKSYAHEAFPIRSDERNSAIKRPYFYAPNIQYRAKYVLKSGFIAFKWQVTVRDR